MLLAVLLAACSRDPEPDPRPEPEPVTTDTADPANPDMLVADQAAYATIYGGKDYVSFGLSVQTADLGGDGQHDLLLGAAHGVTLLYGPAVGVSEVGTGDAEFYGAVPPLAVGDLDADGWPDLVTAGGPSYRAVDVWTGPMFGTHDVYTAELGVLQYPNLPIAPVPHAADVDHDGHDDLIVGLPSAEIAHLGRTGVRVYLGPLEGSVPADQHDVSLVDERITELAGRSLDARHDLDGDGRADLLVGIETVSGQDAGGAWLVHDLPQVDSSLEDQVRIDGADARVEQVAVGGDLDGDGHPDLVFEGLDDLRVLTGPFTAERSLADPAATIAKVPYDDDLIAAGDGVVAIGDSADHDVEVYVTWQTGFREDWDVVIVGDRLGDAAAVGDLDGDGFVDLALGAPQSWSESESAVYVFSTRGW